MTWTIIESLGQRAKVAIFIGAVGAALLVSTAGLVDASSPGSQREAEAEIAKLPLCYARGTDAIGAGDVAAGKAIYAPCFTPNAELAVYFPGTPFDGAPSFVTTGGDSWADFVSGVFTANGYSATQHLMGNIDVDVSGNHATMTSYLHATHVLPNGTIDVANGTYEDEVIRQGGKWRISRRTLKLITFLNLGTPLP